MVIAHRGFASRLPENTIAAFEAALRAGADGIECDVRLSADGVPMVIHDATLRRTTGAKGRVSSLTHEQLRQLDAGGSERIPTLAETAELCRGRAIMCIEFKEAGAVAPALAVLRDFDADDLIFCSFKPKALQGCRDIRPEVPAFLIIGSLNPNPAVRWRELFPLRAIRKTGAAGLSCHHLVITPRRAASVRKEGLGLVVWATIEEERRLPRWFGRALRAAPDAIITAWPDRLIEFLES